MHSKSFGRRNDSEFLYIATPIVSIGLFKQVNLWSLLEILRLKTTLGENVE